MAALQGLAKVEAQTRADARPQLCTERQIKEAPRDVTRLWKCLWISSRVLKWYSKTEELFPRVSHHCVLWLTDLLNSQTCTVRKTCSWLLLYSDRTKREELSVLSLDPSLIRWQFFNSNIWGIIIKTYCHLLQYYDGLKSYYYYITTNHSLFLPPRPFPISRLLRNERFFRTVMEALLTVAKWHQSIEAKVEWSSQRTEAGAPPFSIDVFLPDIFVIRFLILLIRIVEQRSEGSVPGYC